MNTTQDPNAHRMEVKANGLILIWSFPSKMYVARYTSLAKARSEWPHLMPLFHTWAYHLMEKYGPNEDLIEALEEGDEERIKAIFIFEYAQYGKGL